MRVRSLAVRVCAVLASVVLLPSAGSGQTAPDPPAVISPLDVQSDRNGVNLSTGRINNLDIPSLSVPAAPRLRFDRVQNAAPYVLGTSTFDGEIERSSWTVHTGGASSESFKCDDNVTCESVNQTGSTFRPVGRPYQQAGSGAFWHFNLLHSSSPGAGGSTIKLYYASRIDYPDGETISYTYDTAGYLLGDPFNRTWYRPTRIDSTTGYYITISYQYAGNDVSNPLWGTPGEAKLYAPDNSLLRRITYSGNTVTDYGAGDPTGRTYQIVGSANALGYDVESFAGSVQLPTEASASLTVSQTPGYPLIGSVARDGVTWTYAYTNVSFDLVSGRYIYTKVNVSGPNGYSTAYDMANFNHSVEISKVTDALGRATNYVISGGRVVQVTPPEGNSVVVAYDLSGNITSKTTKAKPGSGLADIVESASYPACPTYPVLCWRPTSYTDARGQVTNFSYNSLGQLTQQLAPADNGGVRRQTDIVYTLTGTLSRKTNELVCAQQTAPATCPSVSASHTEYTYFGNTYLPATVAVTDDATGTTRTTTYTYDKAGRVLSVQGPQNGVAGTKYSRYDIYGRKIWEIGAADVNNLRVAKRFTYRDSDDKATKVETGTGTCPADCNTDALTLTLLEQTDTTYDSRRYPIREATSSGGTNYRVTDRSFLDRGLADCTTVRMNLAALPAATAAGACSLGSPGSQGRDRITRQVYDNAGQLLKIQKAYGAPLQQDYVTYAYTNNGKQQYVTDANGNKAQYVYDGFDRLQCWIFPSKTTVGQVSGDCITTGDYEKYTYDAASNRLSLRKRDASTLTYTYDNLNRVITKVVPGTTPQTRDVYTTYDILGRPLTVKFDSFTGADGITNAYDGFASLTSSTIAMSGFSKAITSLYDADGNRTRVTHPDTQAFTYAYDTRDRLSGIYEGIDTGTPLDAATWNPDDTLNQRSEGSAGASGTATYTYDPIGRLTSQSDAFPSFSASNVGWDLNPPISPINPASQITGETRDNDAYAFTAIPTVNRNYTINGLNQYTAAGPASFCYDANGNLTADGTSVYKYDVENRLVEKRVQMATTCPVTNYTGALQASLIYDPLGRLFQVTGPSSDTRFLTDGDALVAEYDSSGNVTNRYVHGSNAAADDPLLWYVGSGTGTKRYLHADHLGSIVAATNGASAPTILSYDEYGIPGAGNAGRFQYTGQAWVDELGMYYYKARIYSPTLGRFLQTDPVGYTGGINLYAYVGDDPVNASDPTGNCPVILHGCGDSGLDGMEGTPSDGSRLPQAPPPPKQQPASTTGVQLAWNSSGQPSPLHSTAGEIPDTVPENIPGGPYTQKPAEGGRRGSFQGPPQESGPRSQAQWVPPKDGNQGYFKTQQPGQKGWQRFNRSGRPITPEQAHPSSKPAAGVLEGILDMLLRFPVLLFPGQEQQLKCMTGCTDPA